MKATIHYAIDPNTGEISFLVYKDGVPEDQHDHIIAESPSWGFQCLFDDLVPELKAEGYDVHYVFDGVMSLEPPERDRVESVDGNVIKVRF